MGIMLGGLCRCASADASGESASKPQYSFRKGESLCYGVKYRMVAHQRPSLTDEEDVSGRVWLRISEVQHSEGTRIELSARGGGQIIAGSRQIALQNSSDRRVLLMVKADGSIASVRDLSGQPTTFLTRGPEMFSAAHILLRYVAGSYVLFGLQLPAELPGPGGKWIGYYQRESVMFSSESPKQQSRIERLPVEFTFVGHRMIERRPSLVFACTTDFMDLSSVPVTFHFDPVKGQLVKSEMHAKGLGPRKVDLDMSIVLMQEQ